MSIYKNLPKFCQVRYSNLKFFILLNLPGYVLIMLFILVLYLLKYILNIWNSENASLPFYSLRTSYCFLLCFLFKGLDIKLSLITFYLI